MSFCDVSKAAGCRVRLSEGLSIDASFLIHPKNQECLKLYTEIEHGT